jgi:hypothetical protein
MFKCANCGIEALYEYVVSDDFSIKYCQRHLPKFTKSGAAALQLRTITPEQIEASLIRPPKKAAGKVAPDRKTS